MSGRDPQDELARMAEALVGHPGRWQMAVWGVRLLNSDHFRWVLWEDPDQFSRLYAACSIAAPEPGPFQADETTAADISTQDQEKLMETFALLRKQYGEQISALFAHHYIEGLHAQLRMKKGDLSPEDARSQLQDWKSSIERRTTGYSSSQQENIERLTELLSLSPVEEELLTLQLNANEPGFRELLMVGSSQMRSFPLALVLGEMMGRAPSEIHDALDEEGKLVSSGLVRVTPSPSALVPASDHLNETLSREASDDAEFWQRFCEPLEPKSSTASLARFDDRDVDILLPLLRSELPPEGGTHVLVHGPRSIDKRDLVSRYLTDAGMQPHIVVNKHVPASDMPLWTYVAQELVGSGLVSEGSEKPKKKAKKKASEPVLVVPRAEQALAQASTSRSMMSFFGEVPEEDEIELTTDETLTGNSLRCVWLTDQPGFLTESNIGRFLFHCQARPGSRADRRARIEAVVCDFDLSPEIEARLSRYSLLGARQVEQAARLAERIAADDVAERERVILRAVDQSQKALKRDEMEELRDSVTQYSLDYLNLEGRFTPEQILSALKRKPKGSICFYGIPGTGKTQLAEYLAVELDLPLIKKRASDLLSKWLGESEQNLAQMFAEAEAEGAILFLDEADSFLRERAEARAEWSVTQVNEILQQMERFDGLFIAATNLFQSLDAASLRRFTWKLEFKALRPDQAWQMFCNEAGYDPKKEKKDRTESLRDSLRQIEDLAPGDFATIKRQAALLEEDMTPEEWITQLESEAKLKMSGLKKHRMGFA